MTSLDRSSERVCVEALAVSQLPNVMKGEKVPEIEQGPLLQTVQRID